MSFLKAKINRTYTYSVHHIFCFMANTIFGTQYLHTWHDKLGESLEYWINDGLMTIFYFGFN
jgi:Na+/H+ antiporter NhaA